MLGKDGLLSLLDLDSRGFFLFFFFCFCFLTRQESCKCQWWCGSAQGKESSLHSWSMAWTGRKVSDRQWYKTVVLLDVPLEDIRAGTQHTLEPGPVQLHTFQGATSHDGGSTRTVHQQSNLTWDSTKREQSYQSAGKRGKEMTLLHFESQRR